MVKAISLLTAILWLLASFASAGGSAAQPEPFDAETRQLLMDHLQREGYLARYPNGQDLQRGTSAYLWDHRHWLKNTDFHNSRQLAVLVCLLIKKGYANLPAIAAERGFAGWCEQVVK